MSTTISEHEIAIARTLLGPTYASAHSFQVEQAALAEIDALMGHPCPLVTWKANVLSAFVPAFGWYGHRRLVPSGSYAEANKDLAEEFERAVAKEMTEAIEDQKLFPEHWMSRLPPVNPAAGDHPWGNVEVEVARLWLAAAPFEAWRVARAAKNAALEQLGDDLLDIARGDKDWMRQRVTDAVRREQMRIWKELEPRALEALRRSSAPQG